MRPVVFLDIDGVLNGHNFDDSDDVRSGHIVYEMGQRLNRILRAADAEIVLSSAWRYSIAPEAMTLLGFQYLLQSHGIAAKGRLIGMTCRDEELSPRGLQIRDWLNEHGGSPYVVLDDGGENPDGTWSDMGIDAAGHPVVWTNSKVGLTDADVEAAIEIVRRQMAD